DLVPAVHAPERDEGEKGAEGRAQDPPPRAPAMPDRPGERRPGGGEGDQPREEGSASPAVRKRAREARHDPREQEGQVVDREARGEEGKADGEQERVLEGGPEDR